MAFLQLTQIYDSIKGFLCGVRQGRTQRGGGAAGLQVPLKPPKTEIKKNTGFVDIMI
jgi:hypothetical protein